MTFHDLVQEKAYDLQEKNISMTEIIESINNTMHAYKINADLKESEITTLIKAEEVLRRLQAAYKPPTGPELDVEL